MKLTKEHIGKKVRLSDWHKNQFIELKFICHEGIVWINNEGKLRLDNELVKSSRWELIEDPKLPSERILELDESPGALSISTSISNNWDFLNYRISAIVKYLDEVIPEIRGRLK